MTKKYYTKKLGNLVARDAKAGVIVKYHVISGKDRNWGVVPEGSARAIRSFTTQKRAVDFAKSNASKKAGKVIIHGTTGQIRNIVSYTVQ